VAACSCTQYERDVQLTELIGFWASIVLSCSFNSSSQSIKIPFLCAVQAPPLTRHVHKHPNRESPLLQAFGITRARGTILPILD
jgi:hypothetical protein